ncbi:hypothetical protein [Calothrix sp. 336/3]
MSKPAPVSTPVGMIELGEAIAAFFGCIKSMVVPPDCLEILDRNNTVIHA